MALVSPSGKFTGFEFTEISSFSEGKCFINKGELYAFADSGLTLLTEYVYAIVSGYKNGFAIVSRDSVHYGFIDSAGSEICELKYEAVKSFKRGFAPVSIQNKWGLINDSGKLVYGCELDYPPNILNNGLILIIRNSKWAVLNNDLSFFREFQYDFILPSGEAWLGREKQILWNK